MAPPQWTFIDCNETHHTKSQMKRKEVRPKHSGFTFEEIHFKVQLSKNASKRKSREEEPSMMPRTKKSKPSLSLPGKSENFQYQQHYPQPVPSAIYPTSSSTGFVAPFYPASSMVALETTPFHTMMPSNYTHSTAFVPTTSLTTSATAYQFGQTIASQHLPSTNSSSTIGSSCNSSPSANSYFSVNESNSLMMPHSTPINSSSVVDEFTWDFLDGLEPWFEAFLQHGIK